ncbi:MAG: GNAT family N-acetyltransferase [Solirubrobacterales bacterium]|nr:GNAT family N-acetyltransferase [Solirubrobacterales bacterium]
MPAIPELAEPLQDGTVALRLAAERDIPEILIAYQDDPQLPDRLGERRAPSGAELGQLSERADLERESGVCVALTIVERGSDICRGRITVHDIDWERGAAELDIWVVPQFRDRGFARSALKAAAVWLLEGCGLRRLELLTETENEPMMAAAAAAGFVNEGPRRSYLDDHGRRVDEVVWSINREE